MTRTPHKAKQARRLDRIRRWRELAMDHQQLATENHVLREEVAWLRRVRVNSRPDKPFSTALYCSVDIEGLLDEPRRIEALIADVCHTLLRSQAAGHIKDGFYVKRERSDVPSQLEIETAVRTLALVTENFCIRINGHENIYIGRSGDLCDPVTALVSPQDAAVFLKGAAKPSDRQHELSKP